MSFRKDQMARRGFTLTEAAIVLGIMGLILGAVWVAAAAVYRNQRVNSTAENLIQISQNIRSLHSTVPSITGSQTDMINAGVFPRNLVVGTTLSNTWGGAITFTVPTATTFQLEFTALPREACTDLLVKIGGPGRDSGLASVGANGTMHDFSIAASAGPVTPVEAVGSCANAANNTATFIFNLKG